MPLTDLNDPLAQRLLNGTPAIRVDALRVGDLVRLHETDSKDYLLPFTVEHPGQVAVVLDAPEPHILTAGPYAGQQARNGRRNSGEPLLSWTAVTLDGERRLFGGTADELVAIVCVACVRRRVSGYKGCNVHTSR